MLEATRIMRHSNPQREKVVTNTEHPCPATGGNPQNVLPPSVEDRAAVDGAFIWWRGRCGDGSVGSDSVDGKNGGDPGGGG